MFLRWFLASSQSWRRPSQDRFQTTSMDSTSCKHCCQSMMLAHLTSKNRNNTYVHTYIPEIDFFISILYIIITFFLQHVQ